MTARQAIVNSRFVYLGAIVAQTGVQLIAPSLPIMRDALGLTNVRLEHLDLMDLGAEFGQFDYIVAHGLYSWVPEPVRERLLEICRRNLAPGGVRALRSADERALRLFSVEEIALEVGDAGPANEVRVDVVAAQLHADAKKGLHGALGVGRDEDEAARRRQAVRRGARLEVDAGRA